MDELIDEIPEVRKVLGILPLKYGSFLVAFWSLAAGILGLAFVVLYGLGVFNFLLHLMNVTEIVKNACIALLGIVSLVMIVQNGMFLYGVVFNSYAMVGGYIYATIFLVTVILVQLIVVPLLCFTIQTNCLLNSFAFIPTLLLITLFGVFVSFWTYLLLVGKGFREQIVNNEFD